MQSEIITFTATESAKRADQYIADKTSKSRSHIAELISGGKVTVNGQIPKKSGDIKIGDIINIVIEPEKLPDITPKKMEIDIVYDCDRYAIINKAAGVTVHPGAGQHDNTLINGILYEFNIDDNDEIRPGVVHRLDKDTSGLLLVAKDRDAREILSKLFHDRLIDKYYYAIASGTAKFKTKIIEEPIGRSKSDRQKMAVVEDGRYAKTEVFVKEQYNKAFLAEIRLYTGRTHQIRVHMKYINHPLLGDKVYAPDAVASMFNRQALHAGRLVFIDPFSGEKMDITAPLPDDMLKLITNFS